MVYGTRLQAIGDGLMSGVAPGVLLHAARSITPDGKTIMFTPSCCGFTQTVPVNGNVFFCKCGRQFSVSRK